MLGDQGFWSSYGTAASVDWCEPNYVVVSWLAEFWNVCSSAPMLVVGLGALLRASRGGAPLAWRFRACFLGLALVGAGSMAFHGSLLQTAQILDELPMVYCALLMAYCIAVRADEKPKDASRIRRLQLLFSSYGLAFTVAYLSSASYFMLFVVSFAGIVAYLVLRGGYIVFRLSADRVLQRLYLVAAGSFCAAVFLFWFPERGLGCDHAFQGLLPHAWFHLLAATGTYTGFMVVIYDRYKIQGREPSLRWLPLPWVLPQAG